MVFLGLALVLAALLLRPKTSDQDPMLGHRAPPLISEVLPGQTPLPRDIKGPALINFWASWCTPCRAEHPLLMDLKKAGVVIYGIAYKNAEQDVRAWLDSYGDPYTAGGLDPDGRLALSYGLFGVPETFLVGKDGLIKDRIKGPLTPERLQPLLALYHAEESRTDTTRQEPDQGSE